jgi:hypothetical protein
LSGADSRTPKTSFVDSALASLQLKPDESTSRLNSDTELEQALPATTSSALSWAQRAADPSLWLEPAAEDGLTIPIIVVFLLAAFDLGLRSQAYRHFYWRMFGPSDVDEQ